MSPYSIETQKPTDPRLVPIWWTSIAFLGWSYIHIILAILYGLTANIIMAGVALVWAVSILWLIKNDQVKRIMNNLKGNYGRNTSY